MLFLGALVVYINTVDSYILLAGYSEAARATRLRGPLHVICDSLAFTLTFLCDFLTLFNFARDCSMAIRD